MNFFAELRRRNVFRVAIAYLVASWFLLEFTSTFVPILTLPGWVTRLIFLLLVIGLVPTLIAAWALELTPEGIKLDRDVDRDMSVTPQTGRKLNYFIIGMLALIIVGLVIERVFIADIPESAPAAVAVPEVERSVAVLPFADLSQRRDQEWFADGLTEEIMNALARTPDILVSSRTSAFAYKGTSKDVPTIARELGVAHVLEGSIRSTGGRIRMTAQLTRAADGFQLWSQTYDGDADDVIGIQEDVAVRIASALQTAMNHDALQDMMRVGTRSVRAYQAFIHGLAQRARSFRTNDPAQYLAGYEQFELARSIDPMFAAAHREASEFWQVQLNPNRQHSGLTDLAPSEMIERFLERIDLAISTTTDAIERTGSRAQQATVQLRLRTAIHRFRAYLDARPNDVEAWRDLLHVAQLASDRDAGSAALAALKTAGKKERLAATIYMSHAYRLEDASVAADYGLNALKAWPNDATIAYQTHRSLLWAMRIGEAANLVARMSPTNSGNRLVRARQACAEGRRDDVLQILRQLRQDDSRNISEEWMILMLLDESHEAGELLRIYESGEVPYMLASSLIFHMFDPAPYPSLVQMLEREDVTRLPPVKIPFACPQD